MKPATRFQAILAVMMLAFPRLAAAATLIGAVKKMNGQPIPAVQVTASGSNGDTSLSDGTFLLKFDDKQPGDPVVLHPRKTGMAVVNENDLRVILPRVADESPVTLRLCPEGELQDMRRRYYSIDGTDRATAAEIERLRVELERAKKVAAEEKAEREKAAAAFQGAAPVQRSHEARALNWMGTINRYDNRPEEARKAYEEALQVSRKLAAQDRAKYLPDVVDSLNNLGALFVARDLLEEAERVLDEALRESLDLARTDPTHRATVAMTLENLGALYAKQSRKKERRAALEGALDKYRDLAQVTSIYWLRVAETQVKIGAIDLPNDPAAARKAFLEALVLYQGMAGKEPAEYQDEVDSAINSVRDTFNQSLAFYRKLAEVNPDTYLLSIATTLRELRTFLRKQNRIEEARGAFDEELKAYSGLAGKNRETYLPHVSETQYDLGTFLREQNRTEEAIQAFEGALRGYREAAGWDDKTYLPLVARTLYDLGTFLREQNRSDESRKTLDAALAAYGELAGRDLDLPNVATRLYELGLLLRDQQRLDEARNTLDTALKTYQKLEKLNDTYRVTTAKVWTDIGLVNQGQNRPEEARGAFGKAVAAYQSLEKKPMQYAREIEAVRRLMNGATAVPKS